MKLSVIIITKNEAAHIGDCIDSVLPLAAQVVVVDSGSTDGTVEIARERGVQVVVTDDWPGFGPQKNRALDLAVHDWVFSIDADERMTPELADAIRRVCSLDAVTTPSADADRPLSDGVDASSLALQASSAQTSEVVAYNVARLSNFCGRWIRHCGWWPDHVVRLFRRGSARFTDVAVHERVQPQGKVGVLDAHLLHYSYPDMDHLIAKINRYSSDAAAMMHARGKRAGLLSAIGHSLWTFIRIYVVRRGFLDGREGFVIAATAAAGSFFRYGKLMYLGERDGK